MHRNEVFVWNEKKKIDGIIRLLGRHEYTKGIQWIKTEIRSTEYGKTKGTWMKGRAHSILLNAYTSKMILHSEKKIKGISSNRTENKYLTWWRFEGSFVFISFFLIYFMKWMNSNDHTHINRNRWLFRILSFSHTHMLFHSVSHRGWDSFLVSNSISH